jgi:hypothetical protein
LFARENQEGKPGNIFVFSRELLQYVVSVLFTIEEYSTSTLFVAIEIRRAWESKQVRAALGMRSPDSLRIMGRGEGGEIRIEE